MSRLFWLTLRQVKRIIVILVGSTVVLIGILGFLLPVLPGTIIFPIGLSILASECLWAAWVLKKLKYHARLLASKANLTGPPEEEKPDAPAGETRRPPGPVEATPPPR